MLSTCATAFFAEIRTLCDTPWLKSSVKKFRSCSTVALSQIMFFFSQISFQRIRQDKYYRHVDLRSDALMMSCLVNRSGTLVVEFFVDSGVVLNFLLMM